MLSRLAAIGHNWKVFSFPPTNVNLRAMIWCCGFDQANSKYSWSGLERGKAEVVCFQYTFSGTGMLKYEGKLYKATPGTAMILHYPHDHRYWWPTDSEPWEFLWINLTGNDSWHIWKLLEDRGGPIVALNENGPAVTAAADIYCSAIADVISSPFIASSLAHSLSMALCSEILLENPDNYPQSINNALDYCKNNFNAPINMDALAEVAGYSRSHFSRLFTKYLGVSPEEYLISLRIEKSANLLCEGENSVKEVSLRCGFKDPNYFCKVFRKKMGYSPGTLRKSGVFKI